MNSKYVSTLILIGGVALYLQAGAVLASSIPTQFDKNTLAQVESLYGIDEDAAITRLEKEYGAAVQARRIEQIQLPGFAGSWFDSKTSALHVAINSRTDFSQIEQIGATPVLVAHSLVELDKVRENTIAAIAATIAPELIRESYVDFQSNAVVVGVGSQAMERASAYLAKHPVFKVPVRLVAVAENVGFSADLRGADGTQNYTWQYATLRPHPCSVGASAEKVVASTYMQGFLTAGHCGVAVDGQFNGGAPDSILYSDGSNLGVVQQSTHVTISGAPYNDPGYYLNNEDGAWVSTFSGWTPKPQVNGYASAIGGVWAGILKAPVGTTACRFGGSSGGPHCGVITAVSAQICLANCIPPHPPVPIYIGGLTRVDGMCTEDGDSGGPVIALTNQIQGTVSGGLRNSCPDTGTDYVYFQPIVTTLTTAAAALGNPVAILTTHGRSAPTVSSFRCPDPANSGTLNGYHIFTCNFVDFDSQGLTTISWTTSTGASSDDIEVSGNCTVPGPMVNVTLAITNPYGTRTMNRSFPCPTKPMP